jgi:hypothetical protein
VVVAVEERGAVGVEMEEELDATIAAVALLLLHRQTTTTTTTTTAMPYSP